MFRLSTASYSLAAITAITILLLVLFALDAAPILRSYKEWRWDYQSNFQVISFVRIAVPTALVIMAWLLSLLPDKPAPTLVALIGLFLIGFSLQFAVDRLRDDAAPSPLYRATHYNHFGYFIPAAKIDDLGIYLDTFAAQQPELPYPENMRVRTHPPAYISFYWLMIRLHERYPQFTDPVANYLNAGGYHSDTPALGHTRAEESAAYTSGLIIAVLATATLFPLYFLGAAQDQPQLGRRLAFVWIVTAPVVLYLGVADQVTPIFTAGSFLFTYLALKHRAPALMLVAGIICSIALFMSVGSLVIPAISALMTLIHLAPQLLRKEIEAVKQLFAYGIALFLGTISVWLALALLVGIEPIQIVVNTLRFHEEFTAGRSYWPWLLFNTYELLVYTGIPLTILFLYEAVHLTRSLIRREPPSLADKLLIASIVMVILLILSGGSRGEIVRHWLFLTPIVVLGSVRGAQRLNFTNWQMLLIGLLQVAQILVFKIFIKLFV